MFGIGLTTLSWKKLHVTETITSSLEVNSENGLIDDSSHEDIIGSMTAPSEIPTQEVRRLNKSLLRPKRKIEVEAWNVRTLYETSKSAQVTKKMKKYDIDILGISECRRTGSGKMRLNSGHTILYSGQSTNHANGVAIIISKEVETTLLQWQPINDRLITARFNPNSCKLTTIQCYAPALLTIRMKRTRIHSTTSYKQYLIEFLSTTWYFLLEISMLK